MTIELQVNRNLFEVRLTDTTPRSTHSNCLDHVCGSRRVERIFSEVENHDPAIGKCPFCRVKMTSLPQSLPLGLIGYIFRLDLNHLALLFRAVGNSVRTVFQRAGGEPEHITLSIARKILWEGTESKETAQRIRSGFRSTITSSNQIIKPDSIGPNQIG